MADSAAAQTLILKLTCANRPGIVAAVAAVIAEHGGDILESSQFDDVRTGLFFMRVRFSTPSHEAFPDYFQPVAERFDMDWEIKRQSDRGRVLLMVSRFDHCLVDLLYQHRTGSIPMDVVGIVSNHETARPLAQAEGIPFHYLPVTPDTKPQQEAALLGIIEETGADLVVLARYMQVLSDELVQQLHGRAINIHHSFLPSFKGARPYHQAHERGVKLIGATAHYVTGDLDEGPIIEQDTARVRHAQGPQTLTEIGRRVEAQVLARAVKWHLEYRVIINGRKTVVFE